MQARISKWGNSLAVRLPKRLADELGLSAGSTVEVAAENGALSITPVTPIPRYRLADLVAEMKRLGPENEPPLVDWGPDRGAEILPDDAYARGEITPEDDRAEPHGPRRR